VPAMPNGFRDLNHNGTMEPYEDPTRPVEERVDDLLSRMTLEEKVGMLFHPQITPSPDGSLTTTPPAVFQAETTASHRVSGQLMNHFLLRASLPDVREMVEWHNRLQALAASTRLGIPITLSSDPRHSFALNPVTSAPSGAFSQWPEMLGLAAIGDEELVQRFADIARQEYRAIGVRVALHPTADLATEPRWARIRETFGEDANLTSRLIAAYVRGFQGPRLGKESVAAMVKHFPGGGPQKDGEDAHFSYGREQIYPGRNFAHHLRPFEAAFAAGVSQVMPYYAMPIGTEYEPVGFGYNRGVLTGLLRERYGFEGIVCTDFGIVTDTELFGEPIPAAAWGVEHLSREDRLVKVLHAGADQFGGEECPELLARLVRSGRISERRVDKSARRLLREKFVLGLFDDPFLDASESITVVGSKEFVEAGFAAQRAALTVLRNSEQATGGTPFLPLREDAAAYLLGVDHDVARSYVTVVRSVHDADFAILRLGAPYERRSGVVERFFRAGSLDFDAETVAAVLALCERLPTVVVVHLERPAILTPFDAATAALVGEFGASDRAVLDILFGRDVPRGRLPFDLPSSMDEVLNQRSDVPFDMPNPLYRFGHGLRYDH
jgi:beta-glucosidase